MRQPPEVIHVLSMDLARGAQAYARSLRTALDADDARHRILTLFRGPDDVLGPDEELDVPVGPLRKLGFDHRVVLRLRTALRRHPGAVIVAHGGEPLKYVALAAPRSLPIVYLKIGVVTAAARNGWRGALQRALLHRPAAIVGVSEEAAAEAEALLGTADGQRVHLIRNGRDPERFHPREPRAQRPRLIYVGHLTTGKRPDRFVELVGALRDEGHDLDAVAVGDGPLAAALAAPAAKAGVELLGVRRDVPELLRNSDIFVFPSAGEGEGLPGVLIEAAMSGLPIVTTDVPGARSVVSHGESGYVVDAEDAAALLVHARSLLQDEAGRRAMGTAARARAVERFSFESTLEDWRRVLGALVTKA